MSDTHAIYAAAQLGHNVTLGRRPGVLVVDFSCGFTDPASTLGSDLTAPVKQTARLLEVARQSGASVIFTTIAFDSSHGDGGLWLEKIPSLGELEIGSRWAEIDPRLERGESETVVVKKGASAFFGTNLASILVSRQIDTIVLCGATTSGCVRATAIDLLQYGWPTLVPRECVGDRAETPHEANLFDIQAKYADVVSVDDAIAYLKQTAVQAEDAVSAGR